MKTIIEKLEEHEANGMLIFYDNERVNEIDTENGSIWMDNAEEIKESNIDLDYLWIYEQDELEQDDNIADYMKSLKKVIKNIEKIGSIKKLWVYSINEEFILSPDYYNEDFFKMSFICENWNYLELYELTQIKF